MTHIPCPLFDSHCHLDMLVQRGYQLDVLVADAVESGMRNMLTIVGGPDKEAFDTSIQAVACYPNIYVGAGVHPHSASEVTDSVLQNLSEALEHPKVVALGEIGLDYFYNHSTPLEQRAAFIAQLRMAVKKQLPVIIHTRDADNDTIAILRDENVSSIGGVIHCFSSGEALAAAALELGMYISFSGIVTFPNSVKIQQIAARMPENRVLCETDSPFLSPVPRRGRVNVPKNVRYIVEKLAQLRNVGTSQLAHQIIQNTQACFGIG